MNHPRKFRSRLANEFSDYIELMHALGRKFVNSEKVLRHLDGFIARRLPAVRELSARVLLQWMAASPALQPQSRAARLSVVRGFCLYRARSKPMAFVPDRIKHPALWPVRVARHVPFIFSRNQVRQLLRAALGLSKSPRNHGRPRMFFTFLLLLYACGLRVSEAACLRIGDVDFTEGTLRVRDTKFFKTRLVPVAADVMKEVRRHLDALGVPNRAASFEQPLFQHSGRMYSVEALEEVGCELLRTCGLKPPCGRGGARLHDLRHTFAVHRIARWYADGADVQSLLPQLATYMGHKDINSTQYYATVTSEILDHASRRFEHACAPGGR